MRQGEREPGRQKETKVRDQGIELQSKARGGQSDRMDRVKSCVDQQLEQGNGGEGWDKLSEEETKETELGRSIEVEACWS